MKVDIFIPCFMDQMYPETAMNMVKVLEKCGCDVNYNIEQTCCGQVAFNSGFWDEAKEVGGKFINEFSNANYIIVPSASCSGMIKNYYSELFHNSSLHNEYNNIKQNLYELSDFLVNILKVQDLGASLEGVATYHDSCSALREYKLGNEPRQLLKNVKGLELREMQEVDVCCGFGGQFAAKFEPIAASMVGQKVTNALDTEANYIISTDTSCLMHMESYIRKQGKSMQIMHLADVLASGW